MATTTHDRFWPFSDLREGMVFGHRNSAWILGLVVLYAPPDGIGTHLPIGDRQRFVFSPRHFADAIEQEKPEVFPLERTECGTPLPGQLTAERRHARCV